MQSQNHPLEPFFQQVVRNSYEGKLGLHDPDVTGYVAHLLCEFSETDKLYQVRDPEGHPIEELESMILAADPVNGTATSFDAERAMRKYIGDYALFVGGMYPEANVPGTRGKAAFFQMRVCCKVVLCGSLLPFRPSIAKQRRAGTPRPRRGHRGRHL